MKKTISLILLTSMIIGLAASCGEPKAVENSLFKSSSSQVSKPASSYAPVSSMAKEEEEETDEYIKALKAAIADGSFVLKDNIVDLSELDNKIDNLKFETLYQLNFNFENDPDAKGTIIKIDGVWSFPLSVLVMKIKNAYTFENMSFSEKEPDIYSADITGDGYDEIIMHIQFPAANAEYYVSKVATLDNNKLSYIYENDKLDPNEEQLSNSFLMKIKESEDLELKNSITGTTLNIAAAVNPFFCLCHHQLYPDYTIGTAFHANLTAADNFFMFKPTDIDNDGVCEITTGHNVDARTEVSIRVAKEYLVLKYIDGKLQIVKSGFWSKLQNTVSEEEYAKTWYKN